MAAGPYAPVPAAGGGTQALSSFGPATTTGPDTGGSAGDVTQLYESERARLLEFRQTFYSCTQHDWKPFDFSGRMIKPGRIMGTQPLIGGHMPAYYVPLDQRRPSAPYRLARLIVRAFTALLFGANRFPQLRSNDPETQDFAQALAAAQSLATVFTRARNMGGACGTVAVSWQFVNGSPHAQPHSGRRMHVLKWKDFALSEPEYVVQLYQSEQQVFDPKSGKMTKARFWHRRDWTPDADIVFKPALVRGKAQTLWEIDAEQSHQHGDGYPHIVWIRNRPDDDDESSPDGQPDYAELYDQLNSLDIINSVMVKGAAMNLDPTLKLKMDREDIGGAVLKKGSENALVTGKDGDASYMEISGSSLTAGTLLADKQRDQILESAACILVDPDKAAASGMSGTALHMIWAPMVNEADTMRDTYGVALVRLLEQQIESARKRLPRKVKGDDGKETKELAYEVNVTDAGEEEEEVEYTLALPPKVVREPKLDEQGQPTGEEDVHEEARSPGKGAVELSWGEYFPPTPQDRQAGISTLNAAAGGRPVLSQKSAVEQAAALFNLDATEEWLAVAADARQAREAQAAMTPGFGGAVGGEDELPPGAEAMPEAEPKKPEAEPEAPEKPKVELGAADLVAIITVNEARAHAGLPPMPGPEGSMTVAEFKAMKAARGAESGKAVGAAQGGVEAAVVQQNAEAQGVVPPKAEAPPGGAGGPSEGSPPGAPPAPPGPGGLPPPPG